MNIILGTIGLLVVVIAWVSYLAMIPIEKVPERPYLHTLFIILGMGLSVWSVIGKELLQTVPLVLALLSVPTGGLFLYLLTIAALPNMPLKVAVGDVLPMFAAVDDGGMVVDVTAVYRNQRLLLKFFRGHW